MSSLFQKSKEIELRRRVYINLNITGSSLLKYLGYSSLYEMFTNFTEEDKRKCEMLAGPYGRTIYKMYKLKRI